MTALRRDIRPPLESIIGILLFQSSIFLSSPPYHLLHLMRASDTNLSVGVYLVLDLLCFRVNIVGFNSGT